MQVCFVTSQLLRENNRIQMLCGVLARLHASGAPNDLMTKIGTDFLENLFYRGLIVSSHAVVLTIMDDEENLIAFTAAALDMKRCLRKIVISQPLRSLWYGFSRVLFQPKLWRPFIEAISLNTPEQSQPFAEIIMIATADTYRGRGFGVKLLSMLDNDLRRRGIQACLARVREDNIHAIRMYESVGYHEIGSITFSGSHWKWLVHEVPEI